MSTDNWRQILVFAGDKAWALKKAEATLVNRSNKATLWISNHAPEQAQSLSSKQAIQWLGRELDVVVFDAFSGMNPDALGAISGSIRGGGFLLLLTPALESWKHYNDPEHARIAVHPYTAGSINGFFLNRFSRMIQENAADINIFTQKNDQAAPVLLPEYFSENTENATQTCRTKDQADAVEAIMRVATGHRRRPLVMTSDRGRGKSAALGIAAAQLMQRGIQKIILTAPRLASVEPVFKHACQVMPTADKQRAKLQTGDAVLAFIPPDELLRNDCTADIVFVDEAAAIPAAILTKLLKRYSRIVFATTVHGYEGTGQGFGLRFHQVLNQLTPAWKSLSIKTPIRWSENDPLEKFIFRALALDAEISPAEKLQALTPQACQFEKISQRTLAENDGCLNAVFGLLVMAHYQTKPSDLRQLLDGLNVSIYVLRFQQTIVATALVAAEGGFEHALAQAIYAGERRPQGHLLAQSLALHAGFIDAPMLRFGRIMRIAVHPAAQKKGLGRLLIEKIRIQLSEADYDGIGVSFGATPGLLSFWQKCGLPVVRMGVQRSTSSGEYAALLLQGLSKQGERLGSLAAQRFHQYLPDSLMTSLKDLEPKMVQALLSQVGSPLTASYTPQDWNDLTSFAFGARGLEANIGPLKKLVLYAGQQNHLDWVADTGQKELLIRKIIQGHDWAEVCAEGQLKGKKQALASLKMAIQILLEAYAPEMFLAGARNPKKRHSISKHDE